MSFIKYNITVSSYRTSQKIEVPKNCNGWTAINLGDVIAEINGIVLNAGVPGTSAGDAVQIGGNEGEIYADNQLRLVFVVPTAGVAPNVQIIFKFYI
jgi:hypothetical protein